MNDYQYTTTDFYLCCFLNINGFKYSIEKNKKGICTFIFLVDDPDEVERLKEVKNDYYNNGDVKVLDFKNKIRDIKSEIINEKVE